CRAETGGPSDGRRRPGRVSPAAQEADDDRGGRSPGGQHRQPGVRAGQLGARPGVVRRRRAPRGALEPCGGERTPLLACRSRPVEAGGSLTLGTQGKVASSPDKAGTGQHRQMVWVRRARQEGVTTVNQRIKASQEQTTSSNLMDEGWDALR